ncbi:AraC family transcriptional regulator [Massilia arenosa]|uniref:AraC family transcriptional regulator n=1 Tax=Zemynaea arenosa TaxID=2561931 RepID=A0A4Y9SXP2_9BURK|nr:helix-turn-helix transcriptional regulator [Massilia arenosa]TFW30307.1 AraC family transcriptional regulator [Massilia arenosa]
MAITVRTDTALRPNKRGPSPGQPVRACARDLRAADVLTPHRHPWGQFTFALSGVLRVNAGGSTWIVPPQRAIWVPAEVEHEVVVIEKTQLRPLDILAARSPFPDGQCRVLEVSPLLREAIVALCDAFTNEGSARERVLGELILDELARAPTTPSRIPLPTDKRLRTLCDALLAEPDCARTLGEWAGDVGASERTLARLFDRELGMGFNQWRQQVRLAHAAPLIARGVPLSQVAAELGYASQSAFTAMFKKTFGAPPTVFFGSGG